MPMMRTHHDNNETDDDDDDYNFMYFTNEWFLWFKI